MLSERGFERGARGAFTAALRRGWRGGKKSEIARGTAEERSDPSARESLVSDEVGRLVIGFGSSPAASSRDLREPRVGGPGGKRRTKIRAGVADPRLPAD